MSLPFHIARALLADSAARSRYLRVGMMQTVVALALALTCMGSAKKAANAVDERRDAAIEAEVSKVIQAAAHALAEDKAKDVDPEVMERLRERRRRRIAKERAKQEAAAGTQAGDETSAPRGAAGAIPGEAAADTEDTARVDGDESAEEQAATAPSDEEDASAREQASGTPSPTHLTKKPGSTPPAGMSEAASADQPVSSGDETRTSEHQAQDARKDAASQPTKTTGERPAAEAPANTAEKHARVAQPAEASEPKAQTSKKHAAATQPTAPTGDRESAKKRAPATQPAEGSETPAPPPKKHAAATQPTAPTGDRETSEKHAAAIQPGEPTGDRAASESAARSAQPPASTRLAETAVPGTPSTGSGAIEDGTPKAPESTEAVLDDVDSLPPDVRESLRAASAAMKQATEAEAARDKSLEQRVRDVEAAASGQSDGGPSLASALGALIAEAIATEAKQSGAEEQADGVAGAPSSGKPRKKVSPPPPEEDALPFLSFKGFSLIGLPFWIALFAAMQIAQWVIIALSRDYHDVISRDASLLTRIEPEDEAFTPHVRLNVQWLRKKVQRRVRAMILFAVGVPAAVFVVSPLFCTGLSSPLITVITTLWGMWWLMVFTAAKSCRAWDAVEGQRPPWFLRAWTVLTTRVPGLRWGILQRYGAMWTRRTSEVYAPVASVERHPWAYAGLSLVRFVGSFAPLKFFVRPLIPVASAHILQHERARRLPPTSPDQDHPAKDS